MARRGKNRRSGRLQDDRYRQIISKSKLLAEEYLLQLGLRPAHRRPVDELPYSRRLSAQAAFMRNVAATQDLSQLKERDRVIAYYAQPDVQREMYRYARGRYLTVLRNFSPMFSALNDPGDVLPLMFHYLQDRGTRWPSMHGTILRHNESGQRICDFVFEPDFKKNWAVAFNAARPIVRLFLSMGLPFFIKFSGSTSPHIIVPGEALSSAGGWEMNKRDFREQVYGFVRSRMNNPGLLDGANWQPDHFLRLVYSIHELGGRVSLPIKPEEFDSFSPDKARIGSFEVMEGWWHVPEDAAERGKEFVQQITRNYPRLVRGTGKLEPEHKWKPPEAPRKLRQVLDVGWYAKVLANGRQLLMSVSIAADVRSGAMAEALAMLKRWEGAGLIIDLKAAADVFEVDVVQLHRHWQSTGKQGHFTPAILGTDVPGSVNAGSDNASTLSPDSNNLGFSKACEYYSRSDVQEAIYDYASGRCFRAPAPNAHFRLQQSSDIPLLAVYFNSSEPNWRGFECTIAKYDPTQNQIVSCDVRIGIDFSRSDCVSAVELAQALADLLRKYGVFFFFKFDGNEILELVIPAEALPGQVDGHDTALQMHQIASGLNRGLRKMPVVNGNDCALIIQPYGYTRPAYSLNPETGLACVVIMPEELQGFSPDAAEPAQVSVSRSWLEVPRDAPLQSQRFLKYVLSPDWQPQTVTIWGGGMN